MLAYQARYNDEVVAKGEPFDTAALEYLDAHFKEQVTTALQDCLLTRPRSPLRFIAEHLHKARQDGDVSGIADGEASQQGRRDDDRGVDAPGVPEAECATGDTVTVADGFAGQRQCVLKLRDGTLCELNCASAAGEPAEQLPGVPVVRLFAPTLYDVEAVVRHLETLAPADPAHVGTILIAEPPPAPQRVVFIGGVPYFVRRYSTCKNGDTATMHCFDEFDDVGETRAEAAKGMRTVLQANGTREGRAVLTDTLSLLREALSGGAGSEDGAQQSATADVLSWQAAMMRLRAVAGDGARAPDAAAGGTSRVTVLLPALQRSYTAVFDRIDEAVREAMHPGYMELVKKGKFFGSFVAPDVATTAKTTAMMSAGSLTDEQAVISPREPPSIVFFSFNKANASLTFARVLAAYVPYYERAQYSELYRCAMRDRARASALQSDFVTRYWAEVQQRRADRDAARAAPRPATRRRRPISAEGSRTGAAPHPRVITTDGGDAAPLTTILTPTPPRTQSSSRGQTPRTATSSRPTRPPTRMRVVDEGAASVTTANAATTTAAPPSPKESKRAEQRRLARERRRQNEDSAFLDVLQALRVQAVTRIQALYRGYRTRHTVRTRRGVPASAAATTDATPPPLPRPPAALPPLLHLCLERLTSLHGSLFGNYPSTTPPAPRRVLRYRPVRRLIAAEVDATHGEDGEDEARERESGEDEVMSEGETWQPELLRIMPQRATRPPPHVNPLRRTLEYLRLARCTMLDEAIFVQRECGGLSLLQHRAYDALKSVALNLIHVAYTELFHRGALTLESMTLYGYMRTHLADVMGCFSLPHLVSRHVMQAARGAGPHCTPGPAAAPAALLTSRRHQAVDGVVPLTGSLTERALCYEYVLVRGTDALTDRASLSTCPSPTTSVAQEPPLDAEHTAVTDTLTAGDEEQVVEGTDAGAAIVMPFACRRLCARVYLTPAVLTAAELTRTLSYVAAQATRCATSVSSPVGHGGGNGLLPADVSPPPRPPRMVAWWNACPYPLVYIQGSPLVLLPRRNEQSVQGMAAFDTFVLDVTDTKTAAVEGGTQVAADMTEQTTDIDMHRTSAHDELPGAADARNEIQHVTPSLSHRGTQPRWPVHSTNSVFDTLAEDDDALQRHLATQLRRHNNQLCYYGTAGDDAASAPPRRAGYLAALTASHLQRVVQDSASPPMTALSVLKATGQLMGNASAADALPVELEYVRPRIPFVCWVSWLYTYEAVVERLVAQLRAGSFVLLSAETSGDIVLIATAVLLARAMETEGDGGGGGIVDARRPTATAAAARQAEAGPFVGGEENGQRGEEDMMQKWPAFFDDYYAQLQAATSRSGVHVDECVATVQDVLRELDGGDLLHAIARAQRDAEAASTPQQRRRCILALTRLSEWYCYLVLLQVFLTMPFNRQAMRVERGGGTTLMSLRQFATTMGLMSWVEQMDPWKDRPAHCPDRAHLRYSNGLRRWDDDGYICFAAL